MTADSQGRSGPPPRLRTALEGSIAIIVVLAIFCAKYMSAMMQQNTFWRSGAWYQFLETPSPQSKAGLLDPVAMAPYYRTLSISLGHQLIAKVNSWLGFEAGTAFLYVAIAAVFTTAVYLIALHFTRSSVKAFFIALVILNTDALAMAHIGACGSAAQAPGRDYMALGFILLGFYFLLESRLYSYWLCLYIGFLLHLPHGSFAFALLFPLTVLRARSTRFIGFHVVSFGLTVLGLYAYQSTGAIPLDPPSQQLWFKWVYIFNGGHIFFDHSIGYLVPNYAFFSVVLAGLAISAAKPDQRSIMLTVIPVWVLIAIATTVFVYVVPIMLVHQLTPYRSSLTVSAIVLIVLSKLFLDQLSPGGRPSRVILALLGLLAVMSGTFVGVCLSAVVGCLLLAIEHPGSKKVMCLAAALGCAGFLVLCLREYAIYDAYVAARDGRAWALAFVVLTVLALFRDYRLTPLPIRRMATPIAAAAVVLLAATTPSRYVNQPDHAQLDKLDDYLKASRVITAYSYEREPVLTAPLIDMPMLEVMAGRGSVLQLIKAHVVYLAPGLLPGFNGTLHSFGIDIASVDDWDDLLREAPGIWKKTATSEHLRQLGAEYGAKLVLTYQDHDPGLPALYRGTYFSVYRISD
jgi:hypothetical protein